ncbi:hypothetical protein GOBAR_DD09810 [Gossypium barbadense]|nr:hypothetical protein GOBAR_DD09810 [Gossypium barbadense]
MALPLGKLSILVGAAHGIYVVRFVGFYGMASGYGAALAIDYIELGWFYLAPVNSLRQELQILASNGPVTIVTGHGSGSSKYRIIIVVVVVGYGYVWWKGWRLPDLMFATRRSLSDARDAIAKQLDSVYSSISANIAATTQDEVSLLQDKSKMLNSNVHSVRYVVQTLESKINRIEGKQDMTNEGVNWLCDYAQTMEQNRPTDRIQAATASSSRPALETPTRTPSRVRFFFSLIHGE